MLPKFLKLFFELWVEGPGERKMDKTHGSVKQESDWMDTQINLIIFLLVYQRCGWCFKAGGKTGDSVVKFLDLIQALNFYHRLTRTHLLEFAKKESLDLIHRIILSDHCSIHLRPCNHNQLPRFSSQDSFRITTLWPCVY